MKERKRGGGGGKRILVVSFPFLHSLTPALVRRGHRPRGRGGEKRKKGEKKERKV